MFVEKTLAIFVFSGKWSCYIQQATKNKSHVLAPRSQ